MVQSILNMHFPNISRQANIAELHYMYCVFRIVQQRWKNLLGIASIYLLPAHHLCNSNRPGFCSALLWKLLKYFKTVIKLKIVLTEPRADRVGNIPKPKMPFGRLC